VNAKSCFWCCLVISVVATSSAKSGAQTVDEATSRLLLPAPRLHCPRPGPLVAIIFSIFLLGKSSKQRWSSPVPERHEGWFSFLCQGRCKSGWRFRQRPYGCAEGGLEPKGGKKGPEEKSQREGLTPALQALIGVASCSCHCWCQKPGRIDKGTMEASESLPLGDSAMNAKRLGFSKPLASFISLVALVGSSTAADLSKIPRTIAKEPVYKTKPKYCLVVFGPEAMTRIWLVLDGDVLYVDKNGNGDLTEKGKALRYATQPLDVSDPAYPLQEYRVFSVGEIAAGGVAYKRIEIGHTILKKTFDIGTGFDRTSEFGKEIARLRKKVPDLTRLGVQAIRNGKVRIQATAYASECPKDAPVIHIDGPVTMRPFNVSGLVRGKQGFEFQAVVGTKGVGEDAFAILDYTEIPESAKPVLEIEFPGRAKAIKLKTSLGRC
jgi:hypothetical protein